MKMIAVIAAALGLATVAASFDLIVNPKYVQNHADPNTSVPIDISHLRNNRAFGMSPGDADYNGAGASYPAEFLPRENFAYGGVNYIFPQYQKGKGNDNVLAQGQTIEVPSGRYAAVHILSAAEKDTTTGSIEVTYADKTSTTNPILVPPAWWWPYPFGGDLVFPYYYTKSSINYNRTMVFQTTHWVDSTKELSSVRLPDLSNKGPGDRVHIFAVTLIPATGHGTDLEVLFARSTQTWFEGTNKTQIFEAIINNVGTKWILAEHDVQLTVHARGIKTVKPGRIHRLRPGDQARVLIGIVNDGIEEGTKASAKLVVGGKGIHVSHKFDATLGIAPYDPTYESIYAHESPPWYNDAKYGIFIHWGVYSVPAWGNVGDKEAYAEWYWWNQGLGPTNTVDTYDYHYETYGPDVVYDDFIQNFTAGAFDPKEWVDLFADAGAKYFVQVSKHHDGYALFDVPDTISKRTSVAMMPHRNLLQELFDAAKEHQPGMHRATYFSLPEWFHPDYTKYGFETWTDNAWPGGNASNPYTGEKLPYAGYVHVKDFVTDLIGPEMQLLADMGTEIMWCDIGGPNVTAEFAASYFNSMAAEGKQVLTNNRCGTPGDFDTPEYARYASVQARKWESNLGMDPRSYGYNRATPDDDYMKPKEIVTSLMDIISKNGNFLLDVGPTENGTIIEIEQRSLRDAGAWINSHAEAIFNTTYWFIAPQDGDLVRFTQTPESFYITALAAPNSTLVLREPVPYVLGDEVTVVGGKKAGTVVPSKLLDDGSLELTVSEDVRDADEYAWVFKIDLVGNKS